MSVIHKRFLAKQDKEARWFETPGCSGELHTIITVEERGTKTGLTNMLITNSVGSYGAKVCELTVPEGGEHLRALNAFTLRKLSKLLLMAANEVERVEKHNKRYKGQIGSKDCP